jgi:hypothetical protein
MLAGARCRYRQEHPKQEAARSGAEFSYAAQASAFGNCATDSSSRHAMPSNCSINPRRPLPHSPGNDLGGSDRHLVARTLCSPGFQLKTIVT